MFAKHVSGGNHVVNQMHQMRMLGWIICWGPLRHVQPVWKYPLLQSDLAMTDSSNFCRMKFVQWPYCERTRWQRIPLATPMARSQVGEPTSDAHGFDSRHFPKEFFFMGNWQRKLPTHSTTQLLYDQSDWMCVIQGLAPWLLSSCIIKLWWCAALQ